MLKKKKVESTTVKKKRGIEFPQKNKKKSDVYVLKKNNGMKMLRLLLWTILIFFFFKGIHASLRPDTVHEAETLINNFKAEFSEYKDENEEILGFTQNFVKEYLTYNSDEEQSTYIQRMQPYISSKVSSALGNSDIDGNATAIYVEAYRKEEYAPNQYDVYVKAEIEYKSTRLLEDESTYETTVQKGQSTLKVPVYANKGTYIVEDLPVFVSDSLKMAGYKEVIYEGAYLTDEVEQKIAGSVENFLEAYYEHRQSVIDYYLTKDAERLKFQGLGGRYLFQEISNMQCYQEEAGGDIMCIIVYMVEDAVNGNSLCQECNLTIVPEGSKYYIKDMNARTVNLSY